jgi:hypothetical protein
VRKKLLILLLLYGCGCPNGSYRDRTQVITPNITSTPTYSITKEECEDRGNIWMEEAVCKKLSEFKLPSVVAEGIDANAIMTVQKEYVKAVYSIEKFCNQLQKPKKMKFVSRWPVRIKEDQLYVDPSAVKTDIEAALLEKGVNDPQLEAKFEGFENAQLKDILKVRELLLKHVDKMPILNSVLFSVSGVPLQQHFQVSKNQNNYIVVIDSTSISAEDIGVILKQLVP